MPAKVTVKPRSKPIEQKKSSRLCLKLTTAGILLFSLFFASVTTLASSDVGHHIMDQYVAPLVGADLKSILPYRMEHPLQKTPKVGGPAPKTDLPEDGTNVHSFMRHIGCPFAQKTLLKIRETAKEHSSVHFTVITHGTEQATKEWNDGVEGDQPKNVKFVADTERKLWSEWGVQDHSLWQVFSPSSLLKVFHLSNEGIKNTKTAQNSNRYARAALFVTRDGKVLYTWKAQESGDMAA